jgi:hypothetical protein
VIMLTRDDALKGLKRCMRLAKQDILLCGYTDDRQTWENQAIARRSVYKWLTNNIEEHGVDQAYLLARKRYGDLPLFLSNDHVGEKEALEVFFVLVGQKDEIEAGDLPQHAQIDA